MTAVPGDARLTQDERRSLGCDCWRLDGEWHHKPKCPVPTVEAILRDRLPEATTVTEWGVRDREGDHGPWTERQARQDRALGTAPAVVIHRPHTTYADHYGPWEEA